MGNCTPLADLLVLAPDGGTFLIDVKGLAKPNFWQIKAKPPRPNLYYVLCLVPSGAANRYFLMSQATLNAHLTAYGCCQVSCAKSKRPCLTEIRQRPSPRPRQLHRRLCVRRR